MNFLEPKPPDSSRRLFSTFANCSDDSRLLQNCYCTHRSPCVKVQGFRVSPVNDESELDVVPIPISVMFVSALSAAHRIPVSPNLPQQSYSYEPQVSLLFSGFLNYLLTSELVRLCPCFGNLRFMPVSSSFLDVHLKIMTLKNNHDPTFLGLLCINSPFVKDMLNALNQFPVYWSRFLSSLYWMLLNMWSQGLSIYEFGFTNLFGNFDHFFIFKHYVSEFWVETYALSPLCGDFAGPFLSLTWSSRFWELLPCVQLLSVSCIPVILNLVVFPLAILSLSPCCQARMIILLGILLVACVGKDVFLKVVIYKLNPISWFRLMAREMVIYFSSKATLQLTHNAFKNCVRCFLVCGQLFYSQGIAILETFSCQGIACVAQAPSGLGQVICDISILIVDYCNYLSLWIFLVYY